MCFCDYLAFARKWFTWTAVTYCTYRLHYSTGDMAENMISSHFYMFQEWNRIPLRSHAHLGWVVAKYVRHPKDRISWTWTGRLERSTIVGSTFCIKLLFISLNQIFVLLAWSKIEFVWNLTILSKYSTEWVSNATFACAPEWDLIMILRI